MISEEDIFVLIPFNIFIEEKTTTRQADLKKSDDRVSAKRKQNPKEPVVAQAPPTLEASIDNLDFDNKDSFHLEKKFSPRKRIERLLKHIETNPHVQLNYSTKVI